MSNLSIRPFQNLVDFPLHYRLIGNQEDGGTVGRLFKNPDLAKQLDWLQKGKLKPNVRNITKMIKESRVGEIELVDALFHSIKGTDLADVMTYTVYIEAAGRARDFEKAHEAFCEAKGRDFVDKVIYTAYIKAAFQSGKFQEAKEAFDEAMDQRIGDPQMCNIVITLAGEAGQYDIGKAALEKAQEMKLADVVTYTAFMPVAANEKKSRELKTAFTMAKKLSPLNEVTCITFIREAGRIGLIEEARDAFNQVSHLNNVSIYNAFMNVIGNTGDFDAMETLYEKAKGFADIKTRTIFMRAAGNAGNFEKVKTVFLEMKNDPKIDIQAYNAFITIVANAGEWNEVSNALEEAKQKKGFVNATTFKIIIMAAGVAYRFDWAESAFQQGKRFGDIKTYVAFMNVAKNAGEFAQTKAAFEEAERKGIADAPTYNNYIEVLVMQGLFKEATAMFKKQIRIVATRESECVAYDFHKLSHGAGRILIRILNEEFKNEHTVRIITGHGSEGQSNFLAFKKCLFENLSKDAPGSTTQEITGNIGSFLLTFHDSREQTELLSTQDDDDWGIDSIVEEVKSSAFTVNEDEVPESWEDIEES